MIKVILNFSLLTLLFSMFTSCASFKTIDPFPRKVVYDASKDKEKKPFAKILVRWRNYPLMTYGDMIGYTDEEKAKIKPEDVPYEDYIKFKKRVISAFKETGMYDEKTGTGTVKVDLTSYGRWTYGELTRSFLTETSFIYILPRSLKVNYHMKVEIEREGVYKSAEEISSIKTTFHLLIFPLYPFASFAGAEKGILKNMVWKAVTDSYSLDKGLPIETKSFDNFPEKEKKQTPVQETAEKKQDY